MAAGLPFKLAPPLVCEMQRITRSLGCFQPVQSACRRDEQIGTRDIRDEAKVAGLVTVLVEHRRAPLSSRVLKIVINSRVRVEN